MERLECHVKEYAWGKYGDNSEVARLYAAGHKRFNIGQNVPYAELWMGTHPDGPAKLAKCSTKLSSFLARSKSASFLSNNNAKNDVHLPFIMKVMSIRTTLSLQVHPTKEQAARLHELDPIHYPDRHHKPELAYALTEFQLLCGFRPADQIAENLQAFPCLRALMGEKNCLRLENAIATEEDKQSLICRTALGSCFRQMMNLARDKPDLVEDLVDELIENLNDGTRGCLMEETVRVMKKMNVDFPGDVGVFSPLFLNHMILQPGECCYYAAEELHAYLSGECVECVGCSNNTIRAAMTPKFIDRDALCEVLNYRMSSPESYMIPANQLADFPNVEEYAPDCRDFQLHKVTVDPKKCRSALMPPLECASIIVLVRGKAYLEEIGEVGTSQTSNSDICLEDSDFDRRPVTRGDIIYIPPGIRLRFTDCTEFVEAYRTFSYETGPDHENRKIVQLVPPEKLKPRFELTDSEESGIFEVEAECDGCL
ncbi:hypothetical protein WR25_13192 [Diploscapter pachys]|uniref:mannose-6-phosphate isomerase n=1 Tax=Diploscapter pachys TaxID=2018661 RepID=A0A2A2KPR6_9BILA|nr:hypothetical protein WR25_13192 [Diploscapter pachys]